MNSQQQAKFVLRGRTGQRSRAHHSAALGSLIRHNRALDRWEEVVSGYERQLKLLTEDQPRIDTLLAEGRVLLEQVGSPHRAQKAFERVLEINPHHAGALESLANVRMATGDGAAALVAVEALAGKAEKPEQRSDLWVRAAKMLEERGDKDGAIERYKFALDALPTNGAAASALRAAYLGRGDASSAAELLSREIESTEGKIAKAVLTAISNTRRGSGETREEESTAIQWTLWGKQAENAAEYLGKGSHVNIVGRLRNNNYEKDGETVYGMAFTAEEIDYLDSRAESEARRNGGQGAESVPTARSGEQAAPVASGRKPRSARQPARADA